MLKHRGSGDGDRKIGSSGSDDGGRNKGGGGGGGDMLILTIQLNTRCAWAGGTYVSFPDFCDNRQFYDI
jgi:hypothetical protein